MERDARLRSRFAAASVVVAGLTFSLVSAAALSKAGASEGGFHATGPGGLSIDGKSADVSVADDGTTVSIVVNLANIDTGMGLRDKHTKDALEAGTYPTTTLKVARAALKFPADGASSSGDAPGQLTLHGQTKNVTFHYDATKSGGVYDVKGNTRINVDDYGVKRPSYLGVTVKPDVGIYANFKAKD